jgi:hypothetical protein
MVASQIYDHAARLRSYEIAAWGAGIDERRAALHSSTGSHGGER